MEQIYYLNEILLSEDYEGTKETIKDEIITNLAETRLKFSNDYEFAKNTFIKDEMTHVDVDGEVYEITYGNLLSLLIVARPFHSLKQKFPEEFLFDLADLKDYSNYYTHLLQHFNYSNQIKELIKDVISELAILSGDINLTFGNTVSIKSLVDLGKKVGRFRDLLHYRLPNDEALTFDEIEAIIKKNLAEIMKILSETDNMLRFYISSGAGINSKQFGQVLSLVGSKPDLFGKIIPYPINTSFLRGLDVRSFYINALGARKALITNHQQVRNSGYLTRKLSMLLMDTKLTDLDDCGNSYGNFLDIHVDSKDVLKRFNNRYHINEDGEVGLIDISDETLIGTTLKVASPITCASNKGICRKCYGKLFEINQDLNIGMIAILILTDPLTQRLLSAKHLLETNSSKIDWGTKFEDSFVVNRNLVYPRAYTDTIIIKEEDFIEDEETEEQVFRRFTVSSGHNRIKTIESPMSLFLNKSLMEKLDEHFNVSEAQYEMKLNNLEDGDSFATFIMDNNELSKPLLMIKDLIETNIYIKEHDINEIVNYFIYLLNEAGIGIQSVHMELIVREMMRLKNPDREQFKDTKMPDYEMFRITDANLKGQSLSRALLFEQVKKQLTTLDFDTFEKDQPSILDELL